MTQAEALKIMKTGVNIYLTGSAGSGKTYLLNKYINYLKEHDINVAVTASTGIAATHMNGMTIHSWSGIGIKNYLDERELENLESKKYLWKRYEKARVLIIDEISMLHGNQLEMVEKVCRRFKRNDKPFGGLQVILSGDLFQLPPIVKDDISELDGTGMVYKSKVWEILNPAICYLEEQHRQDDDQLTEILNNIRNNSLAESHFEKLEKRIGASFGANIKPTRIYSHNINVDHLNEKELDQIDKEEKIFIMTEDGPTILVEILKKSCLAHEKLKLKIGAEVMCIKNNFEEGYVNGSRGKIIGFDNETNNPVVSLYNGKTVTLKNELWAIEEDGKIKASVSQIPLRLAWAITVHKSQGMSLDNAEIDLRNTFAYGMGYVALSRVRTLNGISLIGLNPDALKVHPDVFEFDQILKNESFQNELLFKKLTGLEQKKLEEDFILRMSGKIKKIKQTREEKETNIKVPTISITKKLIEEGKGIKEIAKERKLKEETIVTHIEQIIKKYPKINIEHIRPNINDIKKVKKAIDKLSDDDKNKLTPLKNLLEQQNIDMSFLEIKLAKIFLTMI